MIAWKRNRIRNMTEAFMRGYARALTASDGEPYDQAAMFKRLADTGVVRDVAPGLRFKRWDTYSNKIREYGLGFAEQRVQGPKIWRASEICKAFDCEQISFREFMAIQLARTQIPFPSLRGPFETGAATRPLLITLAAFDQLSNANASPHLTFDEFSQLQDVGDDMELGPVVARILACRSGSPGRDWLPDNTYTDIWFNELASTGFVTRMRAGVAFGQVLVPRWASRSQARRLIAAFPTMAVHDSVSANGFHDDFTRIPGHEVLELLRAPLDVVAVEVPADAKWDPASATLSGGVGILGGLAQSDRVVLRGASLAAVDAATVFVVVRTTIVNANASVVLRPQQRRADNQPIALGEG